MKLFLEDERFPVGDCQVVRNFDEFTQVVSQCFPDFISFDHDLGDGPSGYDCAKWLIEYDMEHGYMPANFSFYVHSQNPVGAINIGSLLNNYLKFKNERRPSYVV